MKLCSKRVNNRLAYIDALKGLGIIFVIIGHLDAPYFLKSWIYLFHMPLFFVLSGFFFSGEKNTLRNFIVKKAKQLLYPYFTFGLIYIIFDQSVIFFKNGFNYKYLVKQFLALFYGNYIWENNYQYIGVLWFLVTLFSVSVIYKLITLISPKCFVSFCISLVVMIIGFLVCNIITSFGIRLPFGLDIALIASGFYGFGVVIKRIVRIIENYKLHWIIAFIVISIIIGSILGLINNYYIQQVSSNGVTTDILYLRFGLPPLYVLAAVLITSGLLFLFKILETKHNFFVLNRIGQSSLLIMILHIKLITIINIIPIHLPWYLLCIVLLIVSFAISRLIEQCFPFIFIFPRKK